MHRERAQPLGVKIPLRYASCEMSHHLGSLHWQRMLMLHEACAFTSSRPAYRLQRHKCNILLALSALLLALHRYHGLLKSDSGTHRPRWQDLIIRLHRNMPSMPDAVLLSPSALPGKQPGVRTYVVLVGLVFGFR